MFICGVSTVTSPGKHGGCAGIRMEALSLGNTEVRVTYQYMDIKLAASVTIAAYKPLVVIRS